VDPSSLFLWTGALVAALFVLTWMVSLPLRNASIADVLWGPAFVAVAWGAVLLVRPWEGPGGALWLLLPLLTTLWGGRLALHIGGRNLGKGEDPRYARWREEGGSTWPLRSLFTVFLLQGGILWVVSLPLQTWALGAPSPGWLLAGVVLFAAGFILESVADAQLARFRSDPASRGQVLDTGVWRYSRHPNYFGDAVVWWGLWLAGGAAVGAWWTVISPILMTILLRWVSGVALLERSLAASRPGYTDYMRRTSPFIPLPPKH
jgi:steroid 5-alpha reductase family enzyme